MRYNEYFVCPTTGFFYQGIFRSSSSVAFAMYALVKLSGSIWYFLLTGYTLEKKLNSSNE